MKLFTQHLSPHLATGDAEAAPLVEMNTTPLIDVLLVLIVMLIITIPVPLNAISLDMASRQTLAIQPEMVVVQIDAAGFVVWGGATLPSLADLRAKIAMTAALPNQPELHLQPSADTPYAFVAAILVMAKTAGLRKVGIVSG